MGEKEGGKEGYWLTGWKGRGEGRLLADWVEGKGERKHTGC